MLNWDGVRCHQCGSEECTIFGESADGKTALGWCGEDCFPADDFTFCNECRRYVPNSVYVSNITHPKLQREFSGCTHCLKTYSYRCTGCGEAVVSFKDEGGGLVPHFSCSCYVKCAHCGVDTKKRKLMPHKAGCVNCQELTEIRPHDYKPNKFVMNVDDTDNEYKRNPVTLGLELEYHLGSSIHRSALATAITDQVGPRGCFYFVNDGSLRRREDRTDGIEMVSHPFSYNMLMGDGPSGRRLWKALEIIRETIDIKANDEFPTAGVHIHMNKASLSNFHLYKLQSFLNSNPALVAHISNRDFDHEYCRFVYSSKNELVKRAQEKTGFNNRRKYSALNLDPQHTIEFRTFKSSVYEETIRQYVEFVYALHRWSKTASLRDMHKYDVFLSYISDNKKNFPNLYKSVKEF